jgi:hypothetical protein
MESPFKKRKLSAQPKETYDKTEDTRDRYDIFYQHFTNYKDYYVIDDERIRGFNDLYSYIINDPEQSKEFIEKLMEKFIKNGYSFKNKDDFIDFIDSTIKDMGKITPKAILKNYKEIENEENEENDRKLTIYSYIDDDGILHEYFIGSEITSLLGYNNKDKTKIIRNKVSERNKIKFIDYPGVKIPKLSGITILITRDGVVEIFNETNKRNISSDTLRIFKNSGFEIPVFIEPLTKKVNPFYQDVYVPDEELILPTNLSTIFESEEDKDGRLRRKCKSKKRRKSKSKIRRKSKSKRRINSKSKRRINSKTKRRIKSKSRRIRRS